MFLFKNTENLVKRIGMNMAVYGFAGVFIVMLLAVAVPEAIKNYAFILSAVFSFVAIIGSIISVACFVCELIQPSINKENKKENESYNLNVIYSYGTKIQGSLFEMVKLEFEDGIYYYVTLSMTDKWNTGGEKLRVPSELIKNYEVDIDELLIYIANKHPYMESMNKYRKINKTHNFTKESITPVFKMKTTDGITHAFSYCGETRFSPNRSSTSGYGSDDWFYLCKENNKYFLLLFTDNASYGTAWMCTELLDGDYDKLVKEGVNFWGGIAYSKERTKTYSIRLTDIDSVRHLLPTRSRCRKLTDDDYLKKEMFATNKLDETIKLMVDFLKENNYYISFDEKTMTVVKNNDDPYNRFNSFVAKSDGVYNYIEQTMGSYEMKKRVSCNDFKTSCFLAVAFFVANEPSLQQEKVLISEIQKHIDFVLNNSYDYWRGQFIKNELLSFMRMSFDKIIKIGEFYDGGFTEQSIYLCHDEKGYCIYENSWHCNAGAETHIRTVPINDSIVENNSFESFVKFLKINYPKYEVDRYTQNDEELKSLFKC